MRAMQRTVTSAAARPGPPPPAARLATSTSSVRTRCPQGIVRPARRGGRGSVPRAPPRASGSSGSIWDSDVVQKEFDILMRDFRDLMGLQRRFPEFDVDGKGIYLDKLDDLAERLRIFVTRMRLSGDPQAAGWLHQLNVQLLEAGLSVDTLQAGLKSSTDMMRTWVAEEAKAANDPAAAAGVRARLRAHFDGVPDVAALLSDPEVAPALSDPSVFAAIKDALQDPSRLSAYEDNEAVQIVLRKLAEQQRRRREGGAA